jgi:hypothetical protein
LGFLGREASKLTCLDPFDFVHILPELRTQAIKGTFTFLIFLHKINIIKKKGKETN